MKDYFDGEDDGGEFATFVGLVSKCCGMPSTGEIYDNSGICSGCRSEAEFEQDIEQE